MDVVAAEDVEAEHAQLLPVEKEVGGPAELDPVQPDRQRKQVVAANRHHATPILPDADGRKRINRRTPPRRGAARTGTERIRRSGPSGLRMTSSRRWTRRR